MIRVTRLNGERFILNAELIVEVESTPDTLISLTTRQRLLVRESVEEVVEAVINYKRRLQNSSFDQPGT